MPSSKEKDTIEELRANENFDLGCAFELAFFTLLIGFYNILTRQTRKTRVILENLFDFRSNLFARFTKYGMVILCAKLFFMIYRLLLGNRIKTMVSLLFLTFVF